MKAAPASVWARESAPGSERESALVWVREWVWVPVRVWVWVPVRVWVWVPVSAPCCPLRLLGRTRPG
jgi:hypothetical protein